MNIKPLTNPYKEYKIISDGIIEGYWNEDNSPFQITCPHQLQDLFLFLLNNLENNGNIEIRKSTCADTRTCDWSKVAKEQLLQQSKQHICDVSKGLIFLINILRNASENHDFTKTEEIDWFHSNFRTGFKDTSWWEMHQKKERHHFNNKKFIQDDINLIDVLEQIVDGVMAGMARSGEYRFEPLDNELLQKAYRNTSKLLLDNLEVID